MPALPTELAPDAKNATEHNAAVAAAQAAQDISGQSLKPNGDPETIDALDALAQKKTEANAAAADPDAAAAAEAEAAEKKRKDDEAAAAAAGGQPKIEPKIEDDPEAAAKKKEAEDAEAASRAKTEELFKGIELPPNTRGKSAEAFASVKVKAAQEISAREQKLVEAQAEIERLKEAAKNPITPEMEKEIKELREFRAKLDIEADPEFKKFDVQVSSAQEFIYAQLKKTGKVSDATIEQIKKYGGPENIELGKLFETLADPQLQRQIEIKITEIETAKFTKAQAIDATKKNVNDYVTQRQEAITKAATAHNETTKQHLDTLVAKVDWAKEKQVPAGADEATRKNIEAHNAFVKETNTQLQAALQDDSPEMRALMIAGMGQLFNLQRVHDGTVARVKELEAANKELTAKIEKFKNASVSRLSSSAAPPSGKLPTTEAPKSDVNTPAVDALDQIAKKIIEERQAKGA